MRTSREKNSSSSSARSQRRVLGMAVDVGEELRRGELALDHVALQLGHVDAVGREAAERLVERGGHVAHAEDKGRHHRPVVRRRPAAASWTSTTKRVVLCASSSTSAASVFRP